MQQRSSIAPVASRLGPYLAPKRWVPLTIWLVRFKRKLGLRNDYDLIELLLIVGASASYAPMITLKELSEQSDVPESTIYGWIKSLERKGLLRVIRTKNTTGRYGPSCYDLGPLFARIEDLHRALTDDAESVGPVDNSVVEASADSESPDGLSGFAPGAVSESGQAVRHAPETVTRLPVESENSHGEVPPDLEKQFRGLALAHAATFRFKAGSESFRALWRALHGYAARHNLTRRELETLLSFVSQDKQYLSPDGLWAGLDVFRAAWPRAGESSDSSRAKKAVAA